jgi:uncharacterized LabA/DUF88 family protein
MKKAAAPLPPPVRCRLLILVDEANVISSARALGLGIDWEQLREALVAQTPGRELIEMVIYVGLPPAIADWQGERDKKNKFIHWLRSHGFLVVTKDGAPTDDAHYKANIDVMLAIDAMELSSAMQPDVVMLVSGDADFAHLALALRRRGIRVEVAAAAQNLSGALKASANASIDLTPSFTVFEAGKTAGRE